MTVDLDGLKDLAYGLGNAVPPSEMDGFVTHDLGESGTGVRSRFALTWIAALALLVGACAGADEEPTQPEAEDQPEATDADEEPDAGDEATTDSTEPSEEAEPAELRLVFAAATIQPNEAVGTYAVAEALGFFAEENLTVTTTNADGSTAALQAVASGSADVTAASAFSVVPAVAEGVPVKAFGGLVQNWPYRIGVPPDSDIQAPSDLEGTSIGIISLASASNPYARNVLSLAGLDPDNDAELVPVGTGPTAAAALEGGDVQSLALFTGAYAALENEGLELRYLENDPFWDDLFSITWSTTEDNLSQQPEVYERFGRAVYKALTFSAANPEAAMRLGYEVFPELLPDSGDPEERLADDVVTLSTWLETATPRDGTVEEWSNWGLISEERWSTLQSFMVEAGNISETVPVEDVWDGSLVDGMNDWDRAEVLELANSQ